MYPKILFALLIEKTLDKIRELTSTKGIEYANDDDDQLANFRRLAMEVRMPMESVWLVYFTKHLDSIRHYIRVGEVKSNESITDRIDDAILYLILFKAMVEEKKEPNQAPDPELVDDRLFYWSK